MQTNKVGEGVVAAACATASCMELLSSVTGVIGNIISEAHNLAELYLERGEELAAFARYIRNVADVLEGIRYDVPEHALPVALELDALVATGFAKHVKYGARGVPSTVWHLRSEKARLQSIMQGVQQLLPLLTVSVASAGNVTSAVADLQRRAVSLQGASAEVAAHLSHIRAAVEAVASPNGTVAEVEQRLAAVRESMMQLREGCERSILDACGALQRTLGWGIAQVQESVQQLHAEVACMSQQLLASQSEMSSDIKAMKRALAGFSGIAASTTDSMQPRRVLAAIDELAEGSDDSDHEPQDTNAKLAAAMREAILAGKLAISSCLVLGVPLMPEGPLRPVTLPCCGFPVSHAGAAQLEKDGQCSVCHAPFDSEAVIEDNEAASVAVAAEGRGFAPCVQRREDVTTGEVIGAGGEATVVKGTLRGRPIAVKQVQLAAAPGAAEVACVRQVVSTSYIAGVASPYVCRLHGYCWEHDQIWLLMELCDGNLEDFVRRVRNEHRLPGLPPVDVVNLGLMLCSALRAVHHRARCVHMDITPRNILVAVEGARGGCGAREGGEEAAGGAMRRVKLADFGLSKHLPAFIGSSVITTADAKASVVKDVAKGTAGYAPREQLMETGSRRSDIYSLGASMHYALTGTHPFSGGQHAIIGKVIAGKQIAIANYVKPAALKSLLTSMTAVEASRRPRLDKVEEQLRSISSELLADGVQPRFISSIDHRPRPSDFTEASTCARPQATQRKPDAPLKGGGLVGADTLAHVAAGAPEDAAADTPEGIPADAHEDAPAGPAADASADAPEDAAADTREEIPAKVSEENPADSPEESHADTPADTPSGCDEVEHADTSTRHCVLKGDDSRRADALTEPPAPKCAVSLQLSSTTICSVDSGGRQLEAGPGPAPASQPPSDAVTEPAADEQGGQQESGRASGSASDVSTRASGAGAGGAVHSDVSTAGNDAGRHDSDDLISTNAGLDHELPQPAPLREPVVHASGHMRCAPRRMSRVEPVAPAKHRPRIDQMECADPEAALAGERALRSVAAVADAGVEAVPRAQHVQPEDGPSQDISGLYTVEDLFARMATGTHRRTFDMHGRILQLTPGHGRLEMWKSSQSFPACAELARGGGVIANATLSLGGGAISLKYGSRVEFHNVTIQDGILRCTDMPPHITVTLRQVSLERCRLMVGSGSTVVLHGGRVTALAHDQADGASCVVRHAGSSIQATDTAFHGRIAVSEGAAFSGLRVRVTVGNADMSRGGVSAEGKGSRLSLINAYVGYLSDGAQGTCIGVWAKREARAELTGCTVKRAHTGVCLQSGAHARLDACCVDAVGDGLLVQGRGTGAIAVAGEIKGCQSAVAVATSVSETDLTFKGCEMGLRRAFDCGEMTRHPSKRTLPSALSLSDGGGDGTQLQPGPAAVAAQHNPLQESKHKDVSQDVRSIRTVEDLFARLCSTPPGIVLDFHGRTLRLTSSWAEEADLGVISTTRRDTPGGATTARLHQGGGDVTNVTLALEADGRLCLSGSSRVRFLYTTIEGGELLCSGSQCSAVLSCVRLERCGLKVLKGAKVQLHGGHAQPPDGVFKRAIGVGGQHSDVYARRTTVCGGIAVESGATFTGLDLNVILRRITAMAACHGISADGRGSRVALKNANISLESCVGQDVRCAVIAHDAAVVDMTNCKVANAQRGVEAWAGAQASLQGCRVTAEEYAMVAAGAHTTVDAKECRFSGGVAAAAFALSVYTSKVLLERCELEGGTHRFTDGGGSVDTSQSREGQMHGEDTVHAPNRSVIHGLWR